MTPCIHCRASNDAEDRRCKRCGRRLQPSTAQAAPDTYPTDPPAYSRPGAATGPIATATAPAMAPIPFRVPGKKIFGPVSEPGFPETSGPPNGLRRGQAPSAPVQGFLFSDLGLGRPKVVSLPVLTPRVPVVRRKPGQKTFRASGSASSQIQQSLDFQAPPPPALESVIYCDAPVALPMHRMISGAVDGAITMIAAGAIIALFQFAVGPVAMTKNGWVAMASLAFCVGILYRVIWCFGKGETPGMRLARLRLVNFDGRPATRGQRLRRQVAYFTSLISVGLGIVWALVDEESLSWHDHISKTFPTPIE